MTKKYKNPACIIGEQHHLEAFVKDLEKIGYTQRELNKYARNKWERAEVLSINYDNNNGMYGFHSENHTKSKEFNLPQDWKSALEYVSELEPEQPKWEVGDYFKHANMVFKITKLTECNVYVDGGNIEYSSIKELNEFTITKLAPQEIESHLIKEAEKKGFVKGAKVRYLDTTPNIIQEIELYDLIKQGSYAVCTYAEKEKYFLVIKDRSITIPLPECTLVPSHPEIKVTVGDTEYTAEFKNWGISFNNCAKFNKSDVIKLSNLTDFLNTQSTNPNKTNRKINSIKWGKAEFTINQLKQITDYYNSK